jgi:hypothetical protein
MQKFLLVGCLLTSVCGCAQMRVTKIMPGDRATGCDEKVKGMRYYLSRPYVCIKKPILVTTSTSLMLVNSDGTSLATPFDASQPKGETKVNQHQTPSQPAANGGVSDAAGGNGAAAAAAPAAPAKTADAPAAADSSNLVHQASSTTGTAGSPLTPQPPPEASGEGDVPTSVISPDAIEIVYLPDFDEQYAVHGQNCLSRQAYGLRFEGGWKLTGVNTEVDSTPVPIEFLNLINKAISAARNLELARINPAGITSPAITSPLAGFSESTMATDPKDQSKPDYLLYEVVTERYIKPGVYRINKPWEIGAPADPGAGLLAQLGLPLVDRTYTRIATKRGPLATVLGDLDDTPAPAASP